MRTAGFSLPKWAARAEADFFIEKKERVCVMQDVTDLRVQREIKPKVEDVLPYYLDNEMMESALLFMDYLREHKMNPRWAGVHNAWKYVYKGKPVYYIRLGKEWVRETENVKWVVTLYLNHLSEYEDFILREGWQNIIWDDLHYCRNCNNGCAPGTDRTIIGREFHGLCNGILYSGRFPVNFVNPDETASFRMKKLLELEINARKEKAK